MYHFGLLKRYYSKEAKERDCEGKICKQKQQ